MNENGIAPVRVVWMTSRWILESPVKICFIACIASFVLFGLLGPFLLIIMGQAQMTYKTFLLSHFSEVCTRGWNFGVYHLKEGEFATVCSTE